MTLHQYTWYIVQNLKASCMVESPCMVGTAQWLVAAQAARSWNTRQHTAKSHCGGLKTRDRRLVFSCSMWRYHGIEWENDGSCEISWSIVRPFMQPRPLARLPWRKRSVSQATAPRDTVRRIASPNSHANGSCATSCHCASRVKGWWNTDDNGSKMKQAI